MNSYSRSSLTSALILVAMLTGLITPFIIPTIAHGATGCGVGTSDAGKTVRQSIKVGDDNRAYLLHLPAKYDSRKPHALVFTMHGFAGSATNQFTVSGWNVLADAETLIVVAPEGLSFPQRWNSGNSEFIGTNETDDIAFFRAMLTELQAELCIDPGRIFADGYSNGGGMANRLACELSDTIAAIGTVAAAFSPLDSCEITRPVPLIAFQGTQDTVVSIDGSVRQGLPPVQKSIDAWVTRNGCDPKAEELPVNLDVRGYRYGECDDDAEVLYYIIDGGGHTWPGSTFNLSLLGRTTQTINATQEMWKFYQKHPLN